MQVSYKGDQSFEYMEENSSVPSIGYNRRVESDIVLAIN